MNADKSLFLLFHILQWISKWSCSIHPLSILIFQIVDLDTKRNRNREALNALKNEMPDSGEWPFMTGCCHSVAIAQTFKQVRLRHISLGYKSNCPVDFTVEQFSIFRVRCIVVIVVVDVAVTLLWFAEKVKVCFGNMFIKIPKAKTREMIQKGKQLKLTQSKCTG